MARPRKHKIEVPNLYVTTSRGRRYYIYRDLRTGAKYSLGDDRTTAVNRARILNGVIMSQIADQRVEAILAGDHSHGIKIGTWIDQYLEIQAKRVQDGDIRASTYQQRCWALKPAKEVLGHKALSQLTTLTINSYLQKTYLDRNKRRMAQSVRALFIDLINEAIAAGHWPAEKPNAAQVAKKITAKIKRSRLTLETFQRALAWSKANQADYCWRAYLFALVTAQRLDDIAHCQFTDIDQVDGIDSIRFIQRKGGNRLVIPLELRLDALGMSVGEVINLCRDHVVSRWLFHHAQSRGRGRIGRQVRPKSLSNKFAEAIRALKIDWEGYDPPCFHELRSLSERLYEAQGIKTQHLLGHKHQTTTNLYHDARGQDWIKVQVR